MKNVIVSILKEIQSFKVYRNIASWFGPSFEIKEATEEEWLQIMQLLNPDKDVNKSTKFSPETTNYIAIWGKNIMGHAQLVRSKAMNQPESGYWLYSMGVRLKYRRMGIGEKLTCHVMNTAMKEGAKELSLLVHEDNHPAIRLYEKVGFEPKIISELENRLEKERVTTGRKRIVMAKFLHSSL